MLQVLSLTLQGFHYQKQKQYITTLAEKKKNIIYILQLLDTKKASFSIGGQEVIKLLGGGHRFNQLIIFF